MVVNRKVSSIILCVAGLASVLAAPASAQVRDIDYDWMLVTIDVLLGEQIPGFSYPLAGQDRDGNGIREEDSLAMLSTILRGTGRVAAIPDVATIQADFAYNRQAVDNEMVATGTLCTALGLAGYDCRLTSLLVDLVDDGDVLAGLLLDFLAGLATVADTPQTFTFINSYIDYLVDSMGALIPPEFAGLYSQFKGDLKNDLHFNSGNFRRWGANGNRPNRFGATGDVDTNGSSNISLYSSNREAWLTACSMAPPIHVTGHPSGGTYFTGQDFTLNVTIAGGTAPFSYAWEIADFPNVTTINNGNGIAGATTSGLNFFYPLESHNGWRIWTRVSDPVTVYNGPEPGAPAGAIESDRFGGRTSRFTEINVVYRPFAIRTQPTAGYKNPGQSWDTSFIVWGGRTVPGYQWYKEGVGALSGQTNRSISLGSLQYSDEGRYYCRATGDEGVLESTHVFLGVRDPMAVTGQPSGGNYRSGDAHTFNFSVSGGNPPLTYEWYRANIGSAPGTGGSVVNSGQTTNDPPTMPLSYAIGSLTGGQQGQYYCVVRDMAGQVLTSNTVTVRVLAILQQPLPQDVKPNFPASFEITALPGSGNPFAAPAEPYRYQWYYDNDGSDANPPVAIAGATTTMYTIPVATAGVHDGLYSCVVEDSLGITLSSSNALLTITADPIIFLTQPNGGRKYTGEEHIFSVTVTGGSTGDPSRFTYQWRKNESGTWVDLPIVSSSFVISSLQTSDQGMYLCEVGELGVRARHLALKPTNSLAVFLEVAPPLAVTASPQDASLYVGETFTAGIGFAGGLGTQRFQWYRDGTLLPGSTDENLSIAGVTLGDAGKYRCDVSDDRGISLTTNFAWLTVHPALTISSPPANATVDYSDSHTFTVDAAGGIGDLHYQWKFNGDPVGEDKPLLIVPAVTDTQEGDYSCEVTDSRPTTSSATASLTVNVPFALTAQPASYATYVGGNYTMFVTVIGAKGTIGYQWWFDPSGPDPAAPIPGANLDSLDVVNATTADAGQYQVVVTDSDDPGNPLTSVWATLDVVNHLNFTQQPVSQTDVPVNGSAVFAVQVDGGIGSLSYQWYKNNVSLGEDPSFAYPSNQATLSIPVVAATDEGAYKCVVSDDNESVTSNVVALTLVAGTPAAGPLALSLLSMVLVGAGAWVSRRKK